MLRVRKKQCSTCIYRKDSCLNLKELEDAIKDRHGHFSGFRICHHHNDQTCCQGFYARHRRNSTPLQLADRWGLIEEV